MVVLIENRTGNEYQAIQWTGTNRIEYTQFGRTATARNTKVSCQNIALLLTEKGTYCIVKKGYWIILVDGTYNLVSPEIIETKYKIKE